MPGRFWNGRLVYEVIGLYNQYSLAFLSRLGDECVAGRIDTVICVSRHRLHLKISPAEKPISGFSGFCCGCPVVLSVQE
jgi:hypothetical protein